MCKQEEKHLIFAPGTSVLIDGEEHLITEVSINTGEIQYGTDRSAWHSHDSVTLVSEPTPKSIAEAIRAIYAESESEDEDLESDEDDYDDDYEDSEENEPEDDDDEEDGEY